MFRFVLFLSVPFVFFNSCISETPGPRFPPTKGEIWPKPRVENKKETFLTLVPSQLNVTSIGTKCDLLTYAIRNSLGILTNLHRIVRRHRKQNLHRKRHGTHEQPKAIDPMYLGHLDSLQIDLRKPCEDYPYLEMDESYNLTVSTTAAVLTSDSIWGIIRGLTSFSQLVYISNDYNELRLNTTDIIDYPRYAHRGLLLDTSRHYITVQNILKTLDAMAMNKLNVFHWHIVDDQSFPYQSEKFPQLSEQGAFYEFMVYTKHNIQSIVEYARQRGIRVVPEFDVPGHTRSWGVAFPHVLTQCFNGLTPTGYGPMNPLHNSTYKLLYELFQEVQEWFPDKYFHVGGDEVDLDCWASNPEILSYMLSQNITSVKQIHALFMRNAIPLLNHESVPIVWQEVFDEGVPLSEKSLVQVWKNYWISEMKTVLNAGHRVLFSSSWYLDHLQSGGDWEDFYTADPRTMVNNATLAEGIVGGEACMWGEVVDDRNVMSRVWPRASAVAERLWSSLSYSVTNEVRYRLEEHTCRMIRQGIDAQPPNGPGFCVA